MKNPTLQVRAKAQSYITEFGGYDHRPVIREGNWYDEQNLASDQYPLMTVRRNRERVQAVDGNIVDTIVSVAGKEHLVLLTADGEIRVNGQSLALLDYTDHVYVTPAARAVLDDLDEAVDLVAFAFEHAEPGDLFVQKADASTIGDLAKGVMKVFGETECKIIGSRHGEKLYETLVTREEMLRSVDMGHYYRIAPDARGLNYDKFYVQGTVHTQGDEAYTSHNTNRLDVDGVVQKIMGTDYVKEELEGRPHTVEA